METERPIRARLDRTLGYASHDAIWAYLVDKFYVSEVKLGERSIPKLAAEYRKLAEIVREASGRGHVEAAGEGGTREIARATVESSDRDTLLRKEILSREAEQLPEVFFWRDANLTAYPNRLIAPHQVTPWIAVRGEEDWKRHGQEGLAMRYCLDDRFRSISLSVLRESRAGWMPEPPARLVQDPDDPENLVLMPYEGMHFLRWAENGKRLFMEIPNDGRLFALKELAYIVCHRYWVSEETAVGFILTGSPLTPFAGEYSVVESLLAPSRPFVRMTINPALPARDVRALFVEAKRQLSTKRNRLLQEKARALVAFCHRRVGFVSRQRRSQLAWYDLMKEWNAGKPAKLRYSDVRHFRGDYVRALEHLFPCDKYPLFYE